MANEETQVQTKFHSFLKQRNSKTNMAMQAAQKLVNLYRVLNDFGPDFVDEYNSMLKSSSDEVQMALKALVGGQEVRQYLEFLQLEENKETTKNSGEEKQQVGWLPSCDQEMSAQNGKGNSSVSMAQWTAFVQEQNDKLAKMAEELRAEQHEALTRLMDQLSSLKTVSSSKAQTTPSVKAPTPQYSEIIEEKK